MQNKLGASHDAQLNKAATEWPALIYQKIHLAAVQKHHLEHAGAG